MGFTNQLITGGPTLYNMLSPTLLRCKSKVFPSSDSWGPHDAPRGDGLKIGPRGSPFSKDINWLVVDLPLWKIWKSVKNIMEYSSQYMENKKCLKPPTRSSKNNSMAIWCNENGEIGEVSPIDGLLQEGQWGESKNQTWPRIPPPSCWSGPGTGRVRRAACDRAGCGRTWWANILRIASLEHSMSWGNWHSWHRRSGNKWRQSEKLWKARVFI